MKTIWPLCDLDPLKLASPVATIYICIGIVVPLCAPPLVNSLIDSQIEFIYWSVNLKLSRKNSVYVFYPRKGVFLIE